MARCHGAANAWRQMTSSGTGLVQVSYGNLLGSGSRTRVCVRAKRAMSAFDMGTAGLVRLGHTFEMGPASGLVQWQATLAFKEIRLSLHEHMTRILTAGLAAPSADNRHTIRFQVISDREVSLWGTSDYHTASYQRRALAHVSLGAVVENISIQAAAIQRSVHIRLNLESDPSRPLLGLLFSEGAGSHADLAAWIPERHTNRALAFRGPELSAMERAEISAVVTADLPGCRLAWCGVDIDRSQVLRLVRVAEAERFRVRNQHAELFSSVRFDVGWKRTCAEGLPPGALGVEPFLRLPFRALSNWPVMRTLNLLGGHSLMGVRAGQLPCALAPDVAVVLAPDDSPASLLEAGRMFQRAWLKLTSMGRAFQPFAASALFGLRANDAVEPEFRARARDGWRRVTGEATPVIVFRTGFAKPPMVRASRPPLIDHILE